MQAFGLASSCDIINNMNDTMGAGSGSEDSGDARSGEGKDNPRQKKTPDMVTFSGVKRELHTRLSERDWLRHPIDRRHMAITWLSIVFDPNLPEEARRFLVNWGRQHEEDAQKIDAAGVAEQFARIILGETDSP